MALISQDLRIDYGRGQLLESDIAADPFAQFSRWFNDALAAQLPEPNAMTIATADASGMPSARIVLLKGFDERGFAFFTNYESRKGQELLVNPQAALCFYWQPLERQVRIQGAVQRVSREESLAYFLTRPVSARVGAIASQQSRPVAGREDLERAFAALEAMYSDGNVPLPDHWGGYRVVPKIVEFWQGRPSRLHDRIQYIIDSSGKWTTSRLSP